MMQDAVILQTLLYWELFKTLSWLPKMELYFECPDDYSNTRELECSLYNVHLPTPPRACSLHP